MRVIDASMSTDEVRAELSAIPSLRRDMRERHYLLMKAARDAGLTWRDIALHLGLDSPQAAQQRYQKLRREMLPVG